MAPSRFVPNRIGTDQADADFHPICHGRSAIGCEDDSLVASRREITQGVVLPIALQESADQRFVITGQRVDGSLRAEQHDGRGDQGQRAE
ncbi:Uncharacterised protein [Mycobacteroides abscessus subsp. abscessus]|nr:Uncharacterised protein [Mycobacteroides abscessus subsp. abscessus]